MKRGIWNAEHGLWNMYVDSGINVARGKRTMDKGIWDVKYGPRYVKYGMSSMDHGA